jgi:hypothetical protein
LEVQECEIPFPLDVRPPLHMTKEYGKVEKSNIVVPAEVNEYTMLKPCYLCQSTITTVCGVATRECVLPTIVRKWW